MNSRKTNLRSTGNITVQVPNTASISKCILFHVSKFLEKIIFQFMFEIIKWICQLQVRRQTVPNYSCQIRQFFLPEHVFLRGCSSFKTEDLVFAWSWRDCLYISWKCWGQVSLKNLKASRTKVLIKSFRNGEQFTCQFLIQIWIPSWAGIIKMWLNSSITQ